MMFNGDDALDRALFALPLEEPPADLRGSILTATAYRPVPPFSLWEVVVIGVISAVTVWLLILIAMGGGGLFLNTVGIIGRTIATASTNISSLAWLGAGAATALWLTLFQSPHTVAVLRERFDAERGR
jgi:hypothetical protein